MQRNLLSPLNHPLTTSIRLLKIGLGLVPHAVRLDKTTMMLKAITICSKMKTISFDSDLPVNNTNLLLLCTYPVILSLYMCVFIFGFPCGYF